MAKTQQEMGGDNPEGLAYATDPKNMVLTLSVEFLFRLYIPAKEMQTSIIPCKPSRISNVDPTR